MHLLTLKYSVSSKIPYSRRLSLTKIFIHIKREVDNLLLIKMLEQKTSIVV